MMADFFFEQGGTLGRVVGWKGAGMGPSGSGVIGVLDRWLATSENVRYASGFWARTCPRSGLEEKTARIGAFRFVDEWVVSGKNCGPEVG
jgi:hypothetical protein